MQLNPEPGVLSVTAARTLLQAEGCGPGHLDELVLHTGLLTIKSTVPGSDLGAVVRFEHRTLQEFLAACHFADDPTDLLPHVLDAASTETLAMTADAALRSAEDLQTFLAAVIGEPPPGTDPNARELVDWAPRMAAASACLNEIAPLGVADTVLRRYAPPRTASSRPYAHCGWPPGWRSRTDSARSGIRACHPKRGGSTSRPDRSAGVPTIRMPGSRNRRRRRYPSRHFRFNAGR